MPPLPESSVPPRSVSHRHVFSLLAVLGSLALIAVLIALFLALPPNHGEGVRRVEVVPGMTVANIAKEAEASGVVRSSFLLYTVLTLRHDPTAIFAGVYTFTEPQSVFAVANQFGTGAIDDESVRLTIPEGMRVKEIAELVNKALPQITKEDYEALATPFEGYLYPETYFLPPSFTAADLVELQRETFTERIEPLRAYIEQSSFSEYEILILASIIEREANDETSMRTVSGIFQNRLAIGMALQADASIEYTLDTPLNELEEGELATKLREVDSPYNTYLYPGLPPTPISNPGITAIKAVLEPIASEYFYYLTGTDGQFYYARTLDEHNENVAQYLQ